MITKKVVIIMSFAGDAPTLRQYNIVQFKRLKYHIENFVLNPKDDSKTVKFKANVFETYGGDIPERALHLIKECDIVLGYLSEQNVNVIYELAVRNLLRDELILVKEGAGSLIPIYLQTNAHIVSDPNGDVNAELRHAVRPNGGWKPYANFEDGELPSNLMDYIKEKDGEQSAAIGQALKLMVENPPRRPAYIKSIMDEFDPSRLISNSDTFYATSMAAIKFRPKDDPSADYEMKDIIGKPWVCDWNHRCRLMYGLPDGRAGNDVWTSARLIEQAKKFMNVEDYNAFEKDQAQLVKTIILGNDFGTANVPIKFNDAHPYSDLKNRSFLPCVIFKRRAGQIEQEHVLYFLVVYFDVTDRDLNRVKSLFQESSQTASATASAHADAVDALAAPRPAASVVHG